MGFINRLLIICMFRIWNRTESLTCLHNLYKCSDRELYFFIRKLNTVDHYLSLPSVIKTNKIDSFSGNKHLYSSFFEQVIYNSF